MKLIDLLTIHKDNLNTAVLHRKYISAYSKSYSWCNNCNMFRRFTSKKSNWNNKSISYHFFNSCPLDFIKLVELSCFEQNSKSSKDFMFWRQVFLVN